MKITFAVINFFHVKTIDSVTRHSNHILKHDTQTLLLNHELKTGIGPFGSNYITFAVIYFFTFKTDIGQTSLFGHFTQHI